MLLRIVKHNISQRRQICTHKSKQQLELHRSELSSRDQDISLLREDIRAINQTFQEPIVHCKNKTVFNLFQKYLGNAEISSRGRDIGKSKDFPHVLYNLSVFQKKIIHLRLIKHQKYHNSNNYRNPKKEGRKIRSKKLDSDVENQAMTRHHQILVIKYNMRAISFTIIHIIVVVSPLEVLDISSERPESETIMMLLENPTNLVSEMPAYKPMRPLL